jgi:ABC-type lipoprotein release transport system permease subunit
VFADAPASAVTPAFRSVLLDLDTIDTVTARRTPAFVAFELSLPYLQIVGMGLLAVALISIVVLGARRRTDLAVEIAMTDRMGIPGSTVTMALAGGAMLLGLIGSIIGIVIARQLVAFMLHRLDPGPSFRPSFDGGLSWSAAVLAVGVVTTVSMLGALFEVRSARRAHVVEVLRAVD